MSSPMNYESYEVVPSTSRNEKTDVIKQRQALITQLFSSAKISETGDDDSKPSTSNSSQDNKSYEKTINSVNVVLPVEPYKCQYAVMSKVITAIKQSKNCLLESPTGTGKTLALLCATLAWQRQEKRRLTKQQEDEQLSRNPHMKNLNITTAHTTDPDVQDIGKLSEMQFVKPVHGQKSIYDVPIEECNFSYAKKRKDMNDLHETDGLVGISKKMRIFEDTSNNPPDTRDTKAQTLETDKDVSQDATSNQRLVDNLQVRISMFVDCSLPVIYYGARTHKQLEQVVQEFSRTEYAKGTPMTILSSRENSCIKEFDNTRWASKNDMCRECTKTTSLTTNRESNCEYYTNYQSLKHSTLPPVFDLKKLISVGRKYMACPYYAARRMGGVAQIVFCPYNYLIEPTIRKSMQIDLNNNIVIIDEGHNIEDVCREAASFTFKQTEIEHALKELETASSFRFANDENLDYIASLHMVLKEWSSWFINQKPLIERQPVNDVTAEYVWEVKSFVQTLDNHNIGLKKYPDFSKNAKTFCRKVRDDPRQLVGVTQASAALIESLDTVFGYVFRNSGQCMEDYKPVLIRKLRSAITGHPSKSSFDEVAQTESLSLSVLCLNPGVVFSELAASSRCVLLASGTLSPMSSLYSELGVTFHYTVSPSHVLNEDRVWVGSLGDSTLQCDSEASRSPAVQDALGRVVQQVCDVTPHGVLCFLPSYQFIENLFRRWRFTELWDKLNKVKEVFRESKKMEQHDIIMQKYYKCVRQSRGALLFAVYRGKVAEGMDFKDQQARAVIAVGVPYPSKNTSVKEKMKYNDKYARSKNLLTGSEWYKIQAYRALNQAAGRVVRHARDWGAVLLVDRRYGQPENCAHLSTWIRKLVKHRESDSLATGASSLEAFMTKMRNEE